MVQELLGKGASVLAVDENGLLSFCCCSTHFTTHTVKCDLFFFNSLAPLLSTGYTPALSCAPNRDVADCLALILNSMMPASPMVTIAALPALSITQTVINHHPTNNHISKGVAFDAPPPLRPNHASYCRPKCPLSSISVDDELNDSDSETY